MPLFPRPESVYLHALSLADLQQQPQELTRVDKQFVAMIDDAQRALADETKQPLHFPISSPYGRVLSFGDVHEPLAGCMATSCSQRQWAHQGGGQSHQSRTTRVAT